MLLYIAKSTAILATLLLFYKLFLEKENVHIFKRYFLLGAIIAAMVIPAITFTKYIEAQPVFETIPLDLSQINTVVVEEAPKTDYLAITLWSLYGLGVLFFGIRFLLNLSKLFIKIKRNERLKTSSFINVLVNDLLTPHTFFKYIFFNKDKFKSNAIPKEVEIHEQAHAKQLHSVDVILVELLQVVFWFNPFVYLLKNYVKLNHEFLADQAVLNSGSSIKNYQNILLEYSKTHNQYPIANAINYSSIKKRFTIMKTKTSLKNSWLKSVLLLLLVTILIYGFSAKQVVEKQSETQKNNQEEITPQKINSEGATEEMMKEYRAFIKEVEETKFINGNKINRIIAIYDIMTPEQRNTVKKYPKTVPFNNLSKVKPLQPSITEYNSWKNKTKFALWLDGKHVDNSILNKYSPKDIKYYSSSFVYNNARSKKFPQPYQNHLYTENGFEEIYLKSGVKKYNRIKAQYLKAIDNNIKASELKILKAQVDRAYNSLSEQEIKKYNVVKTKPLSKKTSQNQSTPSQFIKQRIVKQDSKNSKVTLDTYYAGVRFFIYNKGIQYKDTIVGEKIILDKLYEELTENEKKNFFLIIPKPNRKKSPTQEEMDEYKNSKKYAIWIDGVSVPNSELNKYKPNQIANFSGRMTITKKGRSKKYPQPFWCMFYTHEYFDAKQMGKQKTKYGGPYMAKYNTMEKVNKKFNG